jgi:hypothetical protein
MRLALTLYDDNGSSEVASVDCETFTNGCYLMRHALWSATTASPSLSPESTAETSDPVRDAYAPAAMSIWQTMQAMGDLEDMPTISC